MPLPAAVLLAVTLLSTPAAPTSPPEELARRMSDQIAQLGVHHPRVSVQAAPDLDRVAALETIARLLTFPPTTAPDLEVSLTLSRLRGRVVLAGEASRPSADPVWLVVSTPETPEWWPWLALRETTWQLCGGFDGLVQDATAGDLAGDQRLEFAAATESELWVFVPEGSCVRPIARIPLLEDVAPSPVAFREPRTFLRIVPKVGGTAEIWLRRSDERYTRVYGWEKGGLVRQTNREPLLLGAWGMESIEAGLIPGENLFSDPPQLTRKEGIKSPSDPRPWIDLRSVPRDARWQRARTAWAWLDESGILHLLSPDLMEISRLDHCGSAFSVGDWGRVRALCSGDGPPGSNDRVSLRDASGKVLWEMPVEGTVLGLAAGPTSEARTEDPKATALVFVRDGDRTAAYRLRQLP